MASHSLSSTEHARKASLLCTWMGELARVQTRRRGGARQQHRQVMARLRETEDCRCYPIGLDRGQTRARGLASTPEWHRRVRGEQGGKPTVARDGLLDTRHRVAIFACVLRRQGPHFLSEARVARRDIHVPATAGGGCQRERTARAASHASGREGGRGRAARRGVACTRTWVRSDCARPPPR